MQEHWTLAKGDYCRVRQEGRVCELFSVEHIDILVLLLMSCSTCGERNDAEYVVAISLSLDSSDTVCP